MQAPVLVMSELPSDLQPAWSFPKPLEWSCRADFSCQTPIVVIGRLGAKLRCRTLPLRRRMWPYSLPHRSVPDAYACSPPEAKTKTSVADIIRSCLGPKAMLKMLLDPMGGIVLTNDGHAILREIEVSHPAAKSMIELSRTQDEEVGDGTTTVIILGMTPS